MGQQPILLQAVRRPLADCAGWLARARQARRIALMLSGPDAELLEAYALECEAEVRRLIDAQASAIAA